MNLHFILNEIYVCRYYCTYIFQIFDLKYKSKYIIYISITMFNLSCSVIMQLKCFLTFRSENNQFSVFI